MPEEFSERNHRAVSPSMPRDSRNSGIFKSLENKSRNIRVFVLPLILVLFIFGTFLMNTAPLQSLLLEVGLQEERTIEVYGYAWNLLEDPVIDVLVIPNPSLLGWRGSLSEDAKKAFEDWGRCIQLFTHKYGYAYLSEVRFAVYVAGVNDSVDADYDVIVKWVDHFDSSKAAGGAVVLSNSDKEITKASITLPLSVIKEGEVFYLSDADIRNIMADEIGHALGLGHTNVEGDALHGFYEFPQEVLCHSSLDIYGLAVIYQYILTGEFEPPAKSTISLDGTGIPYHYMESTPHLH